MVGVGALVLWESKVLLVKRGGEPGKGLWAVPGGLVKLGERLKEAVAREVLEETGVKVEVGKEVFVHEVIIRDRKGGVKYHYVILDFEARPVDVRLRPGGDALEAGWFTAEEALKLPLTEGTRALLSKIVKGGG